MIFRDWGKRSADDTVEGFCNLVKMEDNREERFQAKREGQTA